MSEEIALKETFGVSNVIVPVGGPKTAPAVLDFTNTNTVNIDASQIVTSGKITYIQGVYIDNADNAGTLAMTMSLTGQRIVAPPNSCGFYNILVPNPAKIEAVSAQAANKRIRVYFYNVPIQAIVWKTV